MRASIRLLSVVQPIGLACSNRQGVKRKTSLKHRTPARTETRSLPWCFCIKFTCPREPTLTTHFLPSYHLHLHTYQKHPQPLSAGNRNVPTSFSFLSDSSLSLHSSPQLTALSCYIATLEAITNQVQAVVAATVASQLQPTPFRPP